MTCQEVRFIPVRFKDAYGPVGAWFLLFKSVATSAVGGDYMVEHEDELQNWAPYGLGKPIPANLRNYLGMIDVDAGKGPLYMETADAIQNIADEFKDDPKAFKRKMKELESEAWEDFLDMTISQAILWASLNVKPEEKRSEIAACEPYFIGSHSGASGAWVSGPEDLDTPYKWGYTNMTTVDGLFAVGDASGASSHKFSSGSHTEGRIAAKQAIKYIIEKGQEPNVDMGKVEELKTQIYAPLELFEAHKAEYSDPEVNIHYIMPRQFLHRLQKIMDEYAGGVTSAFKTSNKLLERGLELMRCWENTQRMWIADSHIRSILFREETRWPGYYFRSDTPKMDNDNWLCFVNCKWDPNTGEWDVFKKDIWNMPGVD
jgi:adenylylsulfate reductase subunit A